MCPSDDSHLTLEFDDHYVIQPSIPLATSIIFTKNLIGEMGKAVEVGFEYSSLNNQQWLSKEEFLKLL
jgi:UDP-N-acetylglucosamine 4,6-dehydratase